MKITIYTVDASDDDCRRVDYCCTVNGEERTLAASCLPGSQYAREEAIEKARKIFADEDLLIYWK